MIHKVVDDLKNILGKKPRKKHLKSIGKRFRNNRIDPEKRKPNVELIITEDGRKYKLLSVENQENRQIMNIKKLSTMFNSLDFVPKIVWADKKHILLEFIEGTYVDFKDKKFAVEFGKCLAVLHHKEVDSVSSEKYIAEVKRDLEYLFFRKVLSHDMMKKISGSLDLYEPYRMRTSVIYANMHNARNYILSFDMKLYFIDLGSFQKNRVTDEALLGYRLFKEINVEAFWASYFENGGTKFLYDNQKFLKIFQHIKKAAKHLRSYQNTRRYDFKQRRLSNKRFRWMMNELLADMEVF